MTTAIGKFAKECGLRGRKGKETQRSLTVRGDAQKGKAHFVPSCEALRFSKQMIVHKELEPIIFNYVEPLLSLPDLATPLLVTP